MIRLPQFNIADRIVDENGRPTTSFFRFITGAFQNLAAQEADTAKLVAAIGANTQSIITALSNANIAVTTANTATTNVNNVTGDLTAAKRTASLVNSYPSPTAVLTASVMPSDATKAQIMIATHTRVYGDGSTVSVTGSTLSNLILGTVYFIGYSDPGHSGGTVVFQARTDAASAVQAGDYHSIGSVQTPASGGSMLTGQGLHPPGVPYTVYLP